MRLPIVVLLGVVAVSTVRAQKHDTSDCDFDGLCHPPEVPCGGEDSFECRSAVPKGLAPISGNNAAKEQEAVDKLAAIGLLNAISEVAENSPPEQNRGRLSAIILRSKGKAKGVLRRLKNTIGTVLRCRSDPCKPGCPRRLCNRPRPRPVEPSYYPESPGYFDGGNVGQLTQPNAYGGYETRPRVETYYVN